MDLSGPAGSVERTHSVPSGEAAACVAEPGICVHDVPLKSASGFTARIALAGKRFVCAIGAGLISAGEPGCAPPGGSDAELPVLHGCKALANSNKVTAA